MRIFIIIELLYGTFSSLNIYDVGDKILLDCLGQFLDIYKKQNNIKYNISYLKWLYF